MTDGRSDGRTVCQTESIMAKTALCIASYADALSKMLLLTQNGIGIGKLRRKNRDVPSINAFKVRLDKLRHTRVGFYGIIL